MSYLTLKHIFGLKGDVKDNIHYLDESTVLYPAGYNLVVYNVEKKSQKFLPLLTVDNGTPDAISSGDISALSIATSRANNNIKAKHVAVAERGESGKAAIAIFDLNSFKKKGKNSIMSHEVQSSEYVCLAFSPDGKFLLAQGGAPDWTLVNWQWEKSKPMQIAKVSNQSGAAIHQVSYCPTDPSVVCVTGNGILRFLHIEQNEFKSIPFSMGKREPQNYLCHCWIDDRILVGTDTGDILVFENAEFRGVLETSPADGKSIDCIQAFSKGFVCGCDEGILYVFDRDDKEIYKQSKSFQIDGNYVKIKSIAISPSEDNVICTLENNQAYVLGLSNTDILKSEEMNFEPLALPFHHMSITGLDVCIRKSLVVTCGMDRSVRIWNYATKIIEVMRFFNEQPHSVAFHPSGLHILVGFSDCLRMMNILMDEMRPFKDFAIKSCKEVQFSHGGQYFAVANGSVIQVFATYTCEMLGSFNVHKAKVRSIYWLSDDSGIISAGMDGCVYTTKIKDGSNVAIAKHKCNYTCAVGSSDGKVYAVGSDRCLKIIAEQNNCLELNAGVVLTQLCSQLPRPPLKDRFLFAGTDTGVVRVFPFPIEGKVYDQQIHAGAITRMRCSPDDNYLFTVSEDGCLAIFSIEQKRDISTVRRHGHEHMLPWAEEILVNRADLEEKMNLLHELQRKVEELTHHNELQLQIREHAYREKLRDVSERFNSELEGDEHRYKVLQDEKEQLEKQYAMKVEQLNLMQKQKLEELQLHHNLKLQQENERYEDMESKIKLQRAQWENDLQLQDESYANEKEHLQKEYEEKILALKQHKSDLVSERDSIRMQMQDTTNLIEQDADEEIDEIKQIYDKKLTVERMTTLRLKDQNAILKRKFSALRDDISENLTDLSKMKDKQQNLYDQIDTLEKDIKGHVKEIKERESTITDKRHRIFELKKKNQELEKFKFVLDYKITELKRQIQPRKQEMKELSEQIAEMDKELKNYKKESQDLQLDVTELNLKFNGMEQNIRKEIFLREEVAAKLSHFKTELHEVFQDIEDSKKLKDGVKKLFQKHVQNSNKLSSNDTSSSVATSSSQDAHPPAAMSDLHSDYQRQRHYLERSLDSHNAKCRKDMRVHIKEHTRIMQENIALTKEVNELRREKYHILVQQKSKDLQKKATSPTRHRHRGEDELKEHTSSQKLLNLGDDTEIQQEQIRALKKQLLVLENEYSSLLNNRPSSSAQSARPSSARHNAVPSLSATQAYPASSSSHDNAPSAQSTARTNTQPISSFIVTDPASLHTQFQNWSLNDKQESKSHTQSQSFSQSHEEHSVSYNSNDSELETSQLTDNDRDADQDDGDQSFENSRISQPDEDEDQGENPEEMD